jgi:Glu-tRNA(Gln) amidotransferase subunit E-like FAD-binding protein
VSSPTPITSTQPSTPQPVFISVQELEDKIAATEEKVEQMLTKTDESEQEIEQQVENIEQIEQAIVQQQIEAESNTNTNTNTATIEALEKKLVQVQNLSSQLQIKQIEQQKELSVAKAKCEALIKQLASKKKLTNFTYDQQELHRLTTPQAVAQFAREQVQAIKDQAQSQKVGLKKTANPTLPKKALTTPQKVAIGGGVVAGALVIIGVVAKVISAKNNKK